MARGKNTARKSNVNDKVAGITEQVSETIIDSSNPTTVQRQQSSAKTPAVTGRVRISVFRNGKLEYLDEGENLIVNDGLTILSNVLSNASSGQTVDTIGFGTDGTTPALGDTGLTGAFTKAIDGLQYPAYNQVQFDWSLDYSENNGMTIQEMGLIAADGTLFSRKTRAPIVKDNTIRIEGSWTITFN